MKKKTRLMDYYVASDLENVGGFDELGTMTFHSNSKDKEHWAYHITYLFTYHPETKEWSHKRFGTESKQLEKEYGMAEWKVAESLLHFMKEAFGERAKFYDRIHKLLHKHSFELQVLALQEGVGELVYYFIEGCSPADGLDVGFGLNKKKELQIFFISEIGEINQTSRVSFKMPLDYPCIPYAMRYMMEESDLRLKIMMAE